MRGFWELVRESVVMQGLLALGCLGVIGYCTVASKPVPDYLVQAFMLILGFYFGSKVAYMQRKGD